MAEGVALLVGDPERAGEILAEVRGADVTEVRRRLVQATLPEQLDLRLVELRLDLGRAPEGAVTYEHLWTACLLMWIESTAVAPS